MKIKYTQTDQAGLHLVEPLWEQLRDHHASRSNYFAAQIMASTFQARSKELLVKAEQGLLHIVLADDELSGRLAGYCISSIAGGIRGELDSIFVVQDYRGLGIGRELMTLSLDWFKTNSIESIAISVIYGNEEALHFYEKYGFYPRTYVLSR
ncbi:ribosomal protein S18 acetylase RimI-like enzyme [Paenibacillus forsythiae]|uniref:Ribosomal protein S18 acetylase RimI-like enzyme n=1 Tax=Paenibacillus forsythiae TaxID=365616 RepID=A0ABU3HC41_9BACL|nr:GNAT family N-acetyltransferase [Paenibacillus forsythiae]MDT3428382.1 ribosomal protein S18 acetylase RimI-like enzyme [Paenibacillus forsythiae]